MAQAVEFGYAVGTLRAIERILQSHVANADEPNAAPLCFEAAFLMSEMRMVADFTTESLNRVDWGYRAVGGKESCPACLTGPGHEHGNLCDYRDPA